MRLNHGGVPAGLSPLADRSPVCVAPFVAMEFDPRGDVLGCCANALYPLGNVTQTSLDDIWRGPRAQQMRAALAEGDLSIGCSVCRHRLSLGNGQLLARYYDNFPVRDGGEWPYSLQFSLHNTCNLECVMCGADRSSKIRTRRSGLDPLPHAYGDRFFEQLEPFLAHAGAVDFSGGEPFLVPEHWRVWDMLLALDHRPLCSLTTNGTVWNSRVEQLLDQIDHHIAVSIDGMTAPTFEAIRVGAKFDAVMANLDRFLAYTRDRGTILTMSWSSVRANWHELGRAMLFCEERGIQIKVQTVIEPEFGLHRLPTDDLESVVEALELEDRRIAGQLVLNREVWASELDQLRSELTLRRSDEIRTRCMEPPTDDRLEHVQLMLLDVEDRLVDESQLATTAAVARADLARWHPGETIGSLTLDREGTVIDADLDGVVEGWAPAAVGASLSSLLGDLEHHVQGRLWVGEEFDEGDRLVQMWWIGRDVRDKSGLILRAVSFTAGDVVHVLLNSDARFLPRRGSPVSLLDAPARRTRTAPAGVSA